MLIFWIVFDNSDSVRRDVKNGQLSALRRSSHATGDLNEEGTDNDYSEDFASESVNDEVYSKPLKKKASPPVSKSSSSSVKHETKRNQKRDQLHS